MLNSVIFFCVAAFTIAAAGVTAFSHNIVRSAFALLGALIGVAGLFGMMGADFLAVVQMMVYVGGVMVLVLFAVMLTHRIRDVNISNQSMNPAAAAVISAATLGMLLFGIWEGIPSDTHLEHESITPLIGENLLSTYLPAFLVAAILLLAVLVGAVTIARHRTHPKTAGTAGPAQEERA